MASFAPQTSGSESSSHKQGCSADTRVPVNLVDGNSDCEDFNDEGFSDVDISDMELDSDAFSDGDDDSNTDSVTAAASSLRWSKELHSIDSPKFSGPSPGATVKMTPDKKAVDYFFLFFPAFLIQLLVLETNRYAVQQQAACGKEAEWTPVTYPEMQAFLGMRVAMTILYLPKLHTYWSNEDLLGHLGMAKIMSRERFYKISCYFHAADSRNNPPPHTDGHDKLHHVRTILNTVNSNCRNMYHPHRNSSLDEAVVKYCRRKSNFPKFTPTKSTRYGFKIWMRADPTNGYCNEFKVYTGRSKDTNGRNNVGLARSVVLDLTKDLCYCSYIVNVERKFTSVALFDELKKLGILARGTIKSYQEGLQKHLATPASYKPSGAIFQRGDMTAYEWPDTKDVCLLSTADDPVKCVSVLRKERDARKKADFHYPSAVSNYSENMSSSNRYGQSRTHLSTARKDVRWWLSLFWFAFDLAIANALVLLRESGNSMQSYAGKILMAQSVNMEDFRRALAIELIDGYESPHRDAYPSKPGSSVHRYVTRADKMKRLCWHCSRKGSTYDAAGEKRRKVTMRVCDKCDEFFCRECFPLYHMQKRIKYRL